MKPSKMSKAYKAYEAGKRDAKKGVTDNPYILAKSIGMAAWWAKGQREQLNTIL